MKRYTFILLLVSMLNLPANQVWAEKAFVYPSSSILITPLQLNSPVIAHLYGKTWKIDQLYADSMCVIDPSVDSLRYTFSSGGAFSLSNGVDTSTMKWEVSPDLHYLYVKQSDTNVLEMTCTIVYLDTTHFVFTMEETDEETGANVIIEYRLVPE